jgi:diguanylate cyclase (GGDEF)-like protein
MASGRSRVDKINKASWEAALRSPEEAIELAGEALELAERQGYAKGEADARLNIGWSLVTRSDFQAALAAFEKALAIYEAIGDAHGEMHALNAIGAANQGLSHYERAMDFYGRSIDLARRKGDAEREASTLNNIAELCLALGNLKEALDYLLKAYDLIEGKQEDELASTILLNVGTAFLKMDNLPIAREFAERSLSIADKGDTRTVSARCWQLLGMIAHRSNRAELALAYVRRAKELADALGDRQLAIDALLETGSIRAGRGELAIALSEFKDALARAEAISSKQSLRIAYERIAEAQELLGEYEIALEHYKMHHKLERELQNEDTNRKLKDLQVRFETEKARQESEIFRLRNVELKEKTAMLERANARIVSISDIGKRITSSLELERMMHAVYDALSSLMDTTTFGIGVYDPDDNEIDFRLLIERGTRLPRTRTRDAGSFALKAAQGRTAIAVGDMAAEIAAGTVPTDLEHAQSLACVPLILHDRVIGVIIVQSLEQRAYDADKVALLEMVAPYVAIALENSLIHDRVEELNRIVSSEKRRLEDASRQIEHLANHDALTGLPNRRLLFELARHMLDSASRSGQIVGVLFIDLDDFKPINDRFGHVVGDRALVSIANRLKMLLRASDAIARVGGDEFVAVLTNIRDESDLATVAGKIIEECRAPLEVVPGGYRVSVSMGISVFPNDSQSIDELIVMADAAMYAVKRDAKNAFAFHKTPSP